MLEVKTPDEVLQVIDAEFLPLADCVEAVPLAQARCGDDGICAGF